MEEIEERESKNETGEITEEISETGPTSISRRDFLKLSGTALGAAFIPGKIRDFLNPLESESDSSTEKYRDWFVNRLREQEKGKWNIHIQELGGEELFEWRDDIEYHPASTIKVPIAIAVMKNINEQYRNEIKEKGLENILNEKGFGGRNFKQLLSAMLVKSEEEATEHCVDFVNSRKLIDENFREMGLLNTTYLPRRSSQRDLYKAWEELFLGDSLGKESKNFLTKLLGEYTVNDDTLIGTLKKNFGDIDIWNKRGSVVTSGLYTVQDTGVVRIGKKFFYVGLAGTSDKYNPATDTELSAFIDEICSMFASYVKETPNIKRKSDMKGNNIKSSATEFSH